MEDLFSPASKEVREFANDHRALPPSDASSPRPKLYNQGKRRSVHNVIELPQSHRILTQLKFEERNPDDPYNYLLITWGDLDQENARESGMLVSQYVEGSILIVISIFKFVLVFHTKPYFFFP